MRKWEVDEPSINPSDLVREQDFIMQVRHMQRTGMTYLILNIAFDSVEELRADRAKLEELQQKVEQIARDMGATYHPMTNGDSFIVFKLQKPADPTLIDKIAAAAVPGGSPELRERMLRSYILPADYTPLRERTNFYVEAARAASTIGPAEMSAAQVLQSDAVKGPLTAWSLSQIERLLDEIDIRRYVRTQPIYERQSNGKWHPLFAEYFVSVDELKNERFPKLNLRTPERLFLELCSLLDKRLLQQLTDTVDSWLGRPININLSVESTLGGSFARFCHALPPAQRKTVGFELNRADLLLDFNTTLNTIKILHDDGFRVLLDSVHPELLPYINFDKFDIDYLKIRVTKDLLPQLAQSAIIEALKTIPPHKLIFFRCDNEAALELGMRLGVTKFQGWLLDDVASQ